MRERVVHYVVALGVGVVSVNVLRYALDVYPVLAVLAGTAAGIGVGELAVWLVERGGRKR